MHAQIPILLAYCLSLDDLWFLCRCRRRRRCCCFVDLIVWFMSKRLYSVSTDNSYLWVSLNTVPKTEKPPTTPWKVTGECIQHISTPHTDWFTGKLFWIRFDCSMTQCARTPNLLHIYGLFVYNRFFRFISNLLVMYEFCECASFVWTVE